MIFGMGTTTLFFAIVGTVADIITLIVLVDIVMIFVLIFVEKMDPRTFASWMILLIVLPVLGFVLYIFLGSSIYSRHKFDPKGIRDEELIEAYAREEDTIHADETENPELEDTINFAKAIRRGGGKGYSSNNEVEIFTEGKNKMDSLFEDLRNAKKYIFAEYYIVRNDVCGNEFVNILTQKVKEGLEVRLMIDAFGNGKGPKKGLKLFKKAGGHVAMFHHPIYLLLSPKKNNRNHRKIAIIDGEIAYCGGMNIGDEYLGKGQHGHWKDASVRIRGGALYPLIMRFISDWDYAKKRNPVADICGHIPPSIYGDIGNERLQIVSGGPDSTANNPVKTQYFTMIRNSRKILYISTPYLIPDDSMNENIKCAAMSGVDVRIIVPDKKDHIFVYWNTLSAANELMKHGVRVFMYNNGFIHSKTIITDDRFCSVGSANIDDRSLVLNFETNVMMYSNRLRDEMYDEFMNNLGESTEYSCALYDQRTTMMKVKIAISRLFKFIS